MTNFLPGTSPTIQTGPRIASVIGDEEPFLVANLDVKGCFDNLRWRRPEFRVALLESKDFLTERGYKLGAESQYKVYNDYFLRHLETGSYTFFTNSDTAPVRGSLPTGFVLSPSLWHFLVMPLCFHLQKMKKLGLIKTWDLCGDDLLILAPATLTREQRQEILTPWFVFAKSQGLDFHYFKNYKDNLVPIHPRDKSLKFEDFLELNPNADPIDQAWSRSPWPKDSVPIYHAGVAVHKDQLCIVSRLFTDSTMSAEKINKVRQMRLFAAISAAKHQPNPSFFHPTFLVRGAQLQETSTAYVANLTLGKTQYTKELSGAEQLSLMLWGPRTPVSNTLIRRKREFKHPTWKREGTSTYESMYRLTNGINAILTKTIETEATGNYFLDGLPMSATLSPTSPSLKIAPSPTPLVLDHPSNEGRGVIYTMQDGSVITADQLLANFEGKLVIRDVDRIVTFELVRDSRKREIFGEPVFDQDGNVATFLYRFSRKRLYNFIEVERKNFIEKRLLLTEEAKLAKTMKLAELGKEAFFGQVSTFKTTKAAASLMAWFKGQDLCLKTPTIVGHFETNKVRVRLSALEEFAYLVLNSQGSGRLNEGFFDENSIVKRREGRWIRDALLLCENPQILEGPKKRRWMQGLMRLPVIMLMEEMDAWDPQVLECFRALTSEGAPVVVFLKPQRSVGVSLLPKEGFFRHQWPKNLLRGWGSKYFPADDDADNLTDLHLGFTQIEELDKLLAFIKLQVKLLDRYAKTFEYHRMKRPVEESSSTIKNTYSLLKAELLSLNSLIVQHQSI